MNRAKFNPFLTCTHRNERPHNRPYLQTFRTELRAHLTPAEAKLWKSLQGSQLDGRKFRRQHSVGNYILDFYCPAERLAVELDGEIHNHELVILRDRERKLFLEHHRIKVIRFENRLFFDQLEYVLRRVKSSFGWWEDGNELPPRGSSRTPPKQGGER